MLSTTDWFFAGRNLLKDIKHHSHSWPFLEPVDTKEVPSPHAHYHHRHSRAFLLRQITDYLDVVKDPIDLQMIEQRLTQPNVYYKTKVGAPRAGFDIRTAQTL